MTNWTDLADASARAAFSAYFLRVERLLAPLPSEAASEVRRELQAHAMHLLAEQGGRAEEALSRLGPPEDFVPDLVAEKLRIRAAKSFAPTHVVVAIVSSAKTGVTGLAAGWAPIRSL